MTDIVQRVARKVYDAVYGTTRREVSDEHAMAYADVVTSRSGCPATPSNPGEPYPVASPAASVFTQTLRLRRL